MDSKIGIDDWKGKFLIKKSHAICKQSKISSTFVYLHVVNLNVTFIIRLCTQEKKLEVTPEDIYEFESRKNYFFENCKNANAYISTGKGDNHNNAIIYEDAVDILMDYTTYPYYFPTLFYPEK